MYIYMKQFRIFTVFILAALVASLISCATRPTAVEKAEKAQLLDEHIENRDFKFIANYAYPLSYQPVYLMSQYNVTVSADTVKAYLPYYGRAYKAPMGSSDGGIKFESTDFESKVEKGKNDGEWIVTIRTQDTPRPTTLYFTLWNNGTARLNVNDQDRQSISFHGTIEERIVEAQKKPK